MIDWDRVTELREEIGPEDFDEIVELFLSEVDNAMMGLGDLPAVAKAWEEQMHFLKGASLNLGFADLARVCQDGENAAAAGQADPVPVDLLTQVYADSKAEFLNDLPVRFAA